MGLAYSSLDKHKEAVDNFKKALELEPDNESYKSNLQVECCTYNTNIYYLNKKKIRYFAEKLKKTVLK